MFCPLVLRFLGSRESQVPAARDEPSPTGPGAADGLSKGMPDSGVEGAGAGPPSRSTACTSTARLSFTKGRHTVWVGWVWFGWGQGFVVRLSPDTPNP